MNGFATGSKYELSYIEETTYGTTPSTPSMTKTRITSDTLQLKKGSFVSNELRSDREIADFRHGNRQVDGDFNFELSFDDSFENFFLALLGCSEWTASGTYTGTSVAALDTSPDSISGPSGFSDSFYAGDIVTISGFTNTQNNGTFTVASTTSTTIVFTSDAMVAEASGNSITITTQKSYAKVGTSIKSFSFERRFTDIGQYEQVTGCRINSMSLTVKPEAMVTGTFGVLGKGWTESTTSLDSSPSEPGSNSPFDSFTGVVKEGGTTIAIVSAIELKVENNLTPAFTVGSNELQQIFEGQCKSTGKITVYFENDAIINKFNNETVTSLEFTLSDGTNSYDFIIPRLKYSEASNHVSNFSGIMVELPFQAYRDPTVGASLKIIKSS